MATGTRACRTRTPRHAAALANQPTRRGPKLLTLAYAPQAWTSGMGYAEAAPWHPWRYKNGTQVAGYAVRYAKNNFTFITVKGGRHEVPETAPEQALELIRRLVHGESF